MGACNKKEAENTSAEPVQEKAAAKAQQVASPTTNKMNILFIIDEDLTRRAVSVYGSEQVKTPNLEALAKDSLVFENAFVQSPMCGPSRAAFLSGLRPLSSGVLTNQHLMSEKTPKYATPFAQLLKQSGAYMISLGKLYHGREQPEPLKAFDRLEYSRMPKDYQGISTADVNAPCEGKRFEYSADPVLEAELKKRRIAYDKAMETWDMANPKWWFEVGIPYYGFNMQIIGDNGKPESCDVDYKKAELAAEMIRELGQNKKQFFLSIGFDKPHVPLTAPKEYIDLYDPSQIKLAEAKPENDKNVPPAAKRMGALPDLFTQWFDEDYPQLRETPERQRQAVAAYYAAASFVDKQVGTLMTALKEAGLYENTIIVFTTDHGFHLGEHGMWSKYSTYDEAIRVPFMVRIPGSESNGKRTQAIVELMDMLPSFLELWDLQVPEYIEGTSFIPVLQKPEREWKNAAFTTFNLEGVSQRADITGHTIRTAQYRYTEWGDKAEFGKELYDFEKDPLEQNNIVDDKAYANIVADLHKRLKEGWKGALPK